MSVRPTDPRGCVPVLVVSDVPAAIDYYVRVFGFDEDFRYGAPVFFGGVCRGPVVLHLQDATKTHRPVGGTCVSLRVDDAMAAHAMLVERGATIRVEPDTRDYGLVDFICDDPDGNQIVFASDVASKSGTEKQA